MTNSNQTPPPEVNSVVKDTEKAGRPIIWKGFGLFALAATIPSVILIVLGSIIVLSSQGNVSCTPQATGKDLCTKNVTFDPSKVIPVDAIKGAIAQGAIVYALSFFGGPRAAAEFLGKLANKNIKGG